VVLLFLSNSCSNRNFHTFSIQVKDDLPEKTKPSMRREWKASGFLGDFGSGQRQGLLPERVNPKIHSCIKDFKSESLFIKMKFLDVCIVK
jgi:hypothetical protein